MIPIEQAIFTSAATERRSGYHLVGTSPGLCDADAKELAAWAPSHDSLCDDQPGVRSVNFHPLPSGAYCVSRTVASGIEPSGRGVRVYTQCLVASPPAFARFGNNPFGVLDSAEAAGALVVHDDPPRVLPTLELAGHASAVDQVLLERLAVLPGAAWMGTLVKAALDSACLGLAGAGSEAMIAGLINCLPPECRTEFSFTTGLRLSVQRPFRVMGLPSGRGNWRSWQQRYNLTVLDFSGPRPVDSGPLDGWAQLIERVLCSGRIAAFAMRLSRHRPELTLADLPALALQLLDDLDGSAMRCGPPSLARAGGETPAGALRQAHAAHAEHRHLAEEAGSAVTPPSRRLHPDSKEVVERLEHLDDLVFEAMDGKPAALESLRRAWPRVREDLGDDLLAESQEQYLRYALSLWEEYAGSRGSHDPSRAVQALDVLCVLFDRL